MVCCTSLLLLLLGQRVLQVLQACLSCTAAAAASLIACSPAATLPQLVALLNAHNSFYSLS
jgi:hypothetical protein